jgi:hypothetical protein
MPYFMCLACKARLRSTAGDADPIGALCRVCGSLLEPVGDLGEIVGYRVVETRRGTWQSGASRAGELIAGRVGEIIARRGLSRARVRLETESCETDSVSPQVQAVSSRAPGTGDDAVRAAALPRQQRRGEFRASSRRSMRGVIGASGAARRKFALRPRPSFGWRAAKWDRPRAPETKTPPSVALARTSRST